MPVLTWPPHAASVEQLQAFSNLNCHSTLQPIDADLVHPEMLGSSGQPSGAGRQNVLRIERLASIHEQTLDRIWQRERRSHANHFEVI